MTMEPLAVPGLSSPVAAPATLGALVREVAQALAMVGIVTPGTEARDLVAAVMDRPRFWPTLHATALVDAQTLRQVQVATRRRVAGAPFAYAVGQASFRFLNLLVDERVLIPRPETERLVELVLSKPQAHSGGVAADIGTGSGAIALALAAEGHFQRVIATDVSLDALTVAELNRQGAAASLRARVEFRVGSVLAPLAGEMVDVLVANPPYIAYEEMASLPPLVRDWEPAQALCCAHHGLEVTESIVAGASQALRPGGLLALEVDSRRAGVVARMVTSTGAFGEAHVIADYSGRERFVMATRHATD